MNSILESKIKQLHNSIQESDLHTLDVGNTFIKAGIFKKGVFQEVTKITNDQIAPITELNHIICSVRQGTKSSFLWKQEDSHFIGTPIKYEKTLGHDRLICSSHLYHVHNLINQSILLVDAGTFITLDFINSEGHAGGFIFPGAEVFLKSYSSGELLPRLIKQSDSNSIPHWPLSTENAIREAAKLYLRGLVAQVEQMARQSNSAVLLTGGSAHLLEDYFSSDIQIESFTDLIHYSLYFTHCKIANP